MKNEEYYYAYYDNGRFETPTPLEVMGPFHDERNAMMFALVNYGKHVRIHNIATGQEFRIGNDGSMWEWDNFNDNGKYRYNKTEWLLES